MKLKKLIQESTWGKRAFGEKLPTLDDYIQEYEEHKVYTDKDIPPFKVNEYAYSPSFKRMINSWETLLEAILGPKQHSKEYKNLVQRPTFKQWLSLLQNGDPKAIKTFPQVLKLAQMLMFQRVAKEKNSLKQFEKNSNKALDAFEKIGKKLKV